MSEDEFRDRLFTELAEDPGPPLGALVADAAADGVRLRRRNRIVQTVAGTAGVTAVAFAATAVAGGIGHGTGNTTASVGSGSTAPVAAATPTQNTHAVQAPARTGQQPVKTQSTPSAPPPNWQPVPGWMTLPDRIQPDHPQKVTAQAAALQLENSISRIDGTGGAFTHVYASTMNEAIGSSDNVVPAYSATLFWNHATIDVQVMQKSGYQVNGCDPSETTNGNVCYDYKLADGTRVNYFSLVGTPGAADPKTQKGQANLTLTRPDGTQIMVMEINGPETGNTGTTRADMPFTEQQLWQIASDAHWGPHMSAAFVAQAASQIQLASEPY